MNMFIEADAAFRKDYRGFFNSILIIQFDIVYVEGEITLVAIECTKR